MCEVFDEGLKLAREQHIPVIFHVDEITQPQGHSTSGSHERYKSQDRLAWEREWDCLKKMREWIIENALCDSEELEEVERNAKKEVKESKERAWQNYLGPIRQQVEKNSRTDQRAGIRILPEKVDALAQNINDTVGEQGTSKEGCNESTL
jgi:TPP-dependent pyruvate/acetoin dehydrogenase alpha subunit